MINYQEKLNTTNQNLRQFDINANDAQSLLYLLLQFQSTTKYLI